MIVDDHQILLDTLGMMLDSQPTVNVVAKARSGQEALKLLVDEKPDIALVDIEMPGMNGIELTSKITQAGAWPRVIMLSMQNDYGYIQQALNAGALGYIVKESSIEETMEAIEEVHNGGKFLSKMITETLVGGLKVTDDEEDTVKLSRREMEILKHLAKGFKTQAIADELSISVHTVNTHRRNMLTKLKKENTPELISYAAKKNII